MVKLLVVVHSTGQKPVVGDEDDLLMVHSLFASEPINEETKTDEAHDLSVVVALDEVVKRLVLLGD